MPKYIATFGDDTQEFDLDASEKGILSAKFAEGLKSWSYVRLGVGHYSVVTPEGASLDLNLFLDGGKATAFIDGQSVSFDVEDARTHSRRQNKKGGAGAAIEGPVSLTAMMPGKIVGVKVKVGDTVKAHQGVVVMEAMKMENELASPKDGVVKEVRVAEGQAVESGAILVTIE